MKRFSVLALLVLGLLTVISGITGAVTQPGVLPKAHIVFAGLFTVVILIHIVINREAIWNYIRGK